MPDILCGKQTKLSKTMLSPLDPRNKKNNVEMKSSFEI